MVVVLKKKMNHAVPTAAVIRYRAEAIRREWSAREHCERYQLAAMCQRWLVTECVVAH